VSIVTGGPGTGKTTVIRSMSAVFRDQGRRVCLAAPTGRAARRLSEVTGEPASTIHKLLGYSPGEGGGFARDRDDPIDADVVVVDEASMVDVPLMAHLVSAVPISSVLILVGDGYQLPPVGPGAVLSEAMESGCVPVYRLERIYRQETQSAIVVNAHRIREGLRPDFEDAGALASGGQCILIEAPEPVRAARTVVDLCRRGIPDALGLDPVRDIQVVTPMHRGEAGTLHLNQALQKALNPAPAGGGERPRPGFRAGDKVMHLRNNYEKAVFNGDIGRVLSADPDGGGLRVEYDGREVSYDPAELDELGLAYAISIHKSQGSEYPAVVIPFLTQHYPMLQRNLIYTALTRARRLAVVVGAVRAVRIALHNDRPRQRLTRLARRIARACRGAGA
jgi:exodeoxyribonuclease V alpha subunit